MVLGLEQPFISKGRHSTIIGCSLPEWLRENVIASTVLEYGRRLRIKLSKLKQRREIVPQRASSPDSYRLSVGSDEDGDEDNEFIVYDLDSDLD